MTVNVAKIDRALQLPDEWDSFAVDYFQTREFLDHTERFNPCQQRYYLLLANGCFQLGVAVYTLRLNLFTYRSIPSPVNVNIIGVPCSVSSSGIVGNLNLLADLFDYLKKHEKGLLMGLNLASAVAVPDLISGRTLPTVEIVNRFQGWEDYVHTLRSDYRRRFLMISRSFQGVKRMQGPCIQFDAEMYRLYLEVLNHSKGKLETLSLEFFKNLPGRFSLTAYFDQEMLLGWRLSPPFRGKFYLFLGGINY